MSKIKAIKNHNGLCWKCLNSFNESQIHIIKIPSLGYGSEFDGWATEIHLCNDCYQESNPKIWSMETHQYNDYCEEYIYEKEMLAYINNLPIQGQQFVKNEFTIGWNTNHMKPQDWIDYKLGILSHDKCKEYNLYSPEEVEAYKIRFTTCEYPANRIYSDGSKSCWCPFGAYGEYGQGVGLNISSKCYECKYYKKREKPIKDIPDKDFEDYMEFIRVILKHGDVLIETAEKYFQNKGRLIK